MPSDCDAAEDGDVWFRVLTQKDHIKRGRIHHSAFTGNAISPPAPTKKRPWSRELSGRLRSKAGTIRDIEDFAVAYCERLTKAGGGTMAFSGVMYAGVDGLRKTYGDILTLGVFFTPIEADPAHADLTFSNWIEYTREAKQALLLWLTDQVEGLHHPGQLHHLPEAADRRSALTKIVELASRVFRRRDSEDKKE